MKHKIRQTVKVKNGVLCPDDLEFNLSGWTGRIIELDEDDESTKGSSVRTRAKAHRSLNRCSSCANSGARRIK
jgi:hypothetical protein